MENAAKALTIAGAVLLAIMVMAIGVYNYSKIRGTADVYVEHFDNVELEKYNSKFTTFIGRKDISAQEIISIISFAKEKDAGTSIFVDGNNITNYTEEQKRQFLTANPMQYKQNNITKLEVKNWYSYEFIDYDSYGQVIELRLKKN